MDRVLGVLGETSADDDADAKCRAIDSARADKDFNTADRLRQELLDAGYDVQTTKDGTTARKKLA